MSSESSITELLIDIRNGDKSAYDELFPKVYDQLRQIATYQIKREYKNPTIRKTALVHEVYLKLMNESDVDWQNRAHFFAIAARAMRQILVDLARKKKAQKRGGNQTLLSFDEDYIDFSNHAEQLIELNDLINKLSKFDERKSKVVEMRFFGGMTVREIAEFLNVSTRTVDRDWLKARSWLYKELNYA